MHQVLTAFLAMILVMIFSMNFIGAKRQTDREVISTEMELMGHAVGTDAMAHILAQPFDEKTADGTVDADAPNVDLLSSPASFGAGKSFDDCDDVDDFHAMAPHTVEFVTAAGEPSGVRFRLEAAVTYVDAMGQPTTTKTFTKRVELTIHGPTAPDSTDYLFAPIRLQRLTSPDWY